MASFVSGVLITALRWFLIILTSLIVFGITWAVKSVVLVGKPDSFGTVEGVIIMMVYALAPVAGISLFAALIRRDLFANNVLFTRFMVVALFLGLILAVAVPPDEHPTQL